MTPQKRSALAVVRFNLWRGSFGAVPVFSSKALATGCFVLFDGATAYFNPIFKHLAALDIRLMVRYRAL